ncbi:SDR family oxidoreductase [Telmatocola sphagniphila]|uniref:SDR family oxidoreductase n=1 Tax=Telmatocola sphagniphila TaxID=1123043 RepID=A0A8E6B3J2_9BACT|nr:SDR family oxidoreductase [Telmatocola sphagniphila]QVL31530.1 SDR family oxidoreductase [Telmatocola sphagniphila]
MTPGVAIVTGSGKKRVGWYVADALARKGYSVAVHYRSSEREARETVAHLQSLNVAAEAFRADLAKDQEVSSLVERVFQSFGRVDVLVNCAAIWERKKLEAVTAEDVRRHFEINTLGTFLCCQQVGLRMVAQPSGGCIINLGDWAEIRPYPDYSAYFPSKGGISVLTRNFAVELGLRNPNIRVNAILPGPVLLPEDLPQAERNEVIASTLVKREGRPENVAQAVLALIENDFITGVCLPVDGGRSVYAPNPQD